MGCCNGRKNRVKPTGSTPVKKTQDKAAQNATSTRANSRRTQTFSVQTKSGKTLKFGSKLEAKAEIARNGGMLRF